jgi:hypothetical protein
MSLLQDIAANDFRSVVLSDGGLSLTWQPPTGGAPITFAASVSYMDPEKDPFASQPSDDVTAMIRALRASVRPSSATPLPRAQDIFVDAEGNRFQIVKVRDYPGTPFINFRARVVPPTAT